VNWFEKNYPTTTAKLHAASVVLFASKLGLPISATPTLVGAVMGVEFPRGLNRVREETVLEIDASWMVTIPVGAVLSIFYTLIFTKLLAFFMWLDFEKWELFFYVVQHSLHTILVTRTFFLDKNEEITWFQKFLQNFTRFVKTKWSFSWQIVNDQGKTFGSK
jgi:hypothetical protein